jgi:hypothetical protein
MTLDGDPRHLRDTVRELDESLAPLDEGTRRRVRVLVTELVAHVGHADIGADHSAPLSFELQRMGRCVRLVACGPAASAIPPMLRDEPIEAPLAPTAQFGALLVDSLSDRWAEDGPGQVAFEIDVPAV